MVKQKRTLDEIRFRRLVKKFQPLINSYKISFLELDIVTVYVTDEIIRYMIRWTKRNGYKILIAPYIDTLYLSVKIYK